jgi:hypothetical protein
MPTPENEHLNAPSPSRDEKWERFPNALDRVLTSAERAQEQAQLMRNLRLMIDSLLGVGWFACALGFFSFLQTYEAKPPTESPAVTLYLLCLLTATTAGVIITVFALRHRRNLKAEYMLDIAYATKVADLLREAVKPDDFPTTLEWHLFQMRLSRFDIGAVPESSRVKRSMEDLNGNVLGRGPGTYEMPGSGGAKASAEERVEH